MQKNVSVSLLFNGDVAERLKAPVSKTGRGENLSWVQIPPSPHLFITKYLHFRSHVVIYPLEQVRK